MSDRYLTFAVDLAKQAGTIIRKNFALGMKKEWKSDNTPLTATDLAVNRLVVEAVQKTYPEHGILSEEEHEVRGMGEYVWVCDPIDGTIPFSHGIPVSTFSLALVQNGQPVLGAVYDPFLERLYVAEKGRGATMNGNPIHVSSASSLGNSLVGLSMWQPDHNVLLATRGELVLRHATAIQLNSIVYEGMLVAAGEMVGIIFPGTKPWDCAAIKIIVEEAGGKVTDLTGNEQRYDRPINGALASNGAAHDELLKIIAATATKR